MSVKKIVFLMSSVMVAMLGITSVMANSFREASSLDTNTTSNVYVESNLGYARQNYFDNENYYTAPPATPPAPGVNLNNHNNAHGGFSAGVDAGYAFNKRFAVELGWFHLPSVNIMQAGSPTGYLRSWVLYLAGKYMMPIPVMHNTDAFFKLGVEYRQAILPAVAIAPATNGYNVSTGKSTFIRPMFATGLDYNFNHNFMGVAQYAYFMGANNSFPYTTSNLGALGTVAANVFTLGLGYQFNV